MEQLVEIGRWYEYIYIQLKNRSRKGKGEVDICAVCSLSGVIARGHYSGQKAWGVLIYIYICE